MRARRSGTGWRRCARPGLTPLIGVAPGPANGFTLDLIACLERFGERIDWAMVILNPFEPWPGELCLDAAERHDVKVITRVVDYGGLFWGDLRARHGAGRRATTAPSAPRAGSRRAWRSWSGCCPIAERAGLTPIQLACQWNLAHPAVECVVPTLIQEAGPEARPIEAKRAELAALPAEQRLTAEDVAEIRAIGDNTGCMALKGANPDHEGEERPDRWALSDELAGSGRRWGIDPARDLAGSPRRLSAYSLPRMDRKWWTLVGACSGLFLLMLDSTVVALALPRSGTNRRHPRAGLQWVMNGYLLVIAVFVVTAGRLGDMFGRKRLFLAGMAVFALGSVLSGAAGDEVTLIAGRVLQGVGAAPMLPLSLAIVCNAFPRSEQARALGIWAGVSALALAIGPLARRRPGRTRLAGDLLDQPAGRRARDRDHGRGGARVDRPRLRPPGRRRRACSR